MTPDPTADLCTTCQPGPVRFPGPTTRGVPGLVCLPADPTAYLARRVWLLSAGPDFLPRPDQPRRPRSGLPPRPDRPAATSRFWFAFQTGQRFFPAHASRPSGVSLSPSTTPGCGLRPPASIRLRLRRRRWSKIWMNDGLGTGQPARLVAPQHRKPTVPLFSQPLASGDLSRAYDVGPHPVSAPVSVGVETQRVRARPGPPPPESLSRATRRPGRARAGPGLAYRARRAGSGLAHRNAARYCVVPSSMGLAPGLGGL